MRTKTIWVGGLLVLATALVLVLVFRHSGGRAGSGSADSTRAAVPVDTMPADLSKVQTSLPPTLPDTFKGPSRTRRSAGEVVREPPIPPAPALHSRANR